MENQKRPIGPQLPMHLYTCNHCFTTFGVENHQDHLGLVCPSCLFDTYMEDAGSGYFQMTSPPEEPMDSTERLTQQIEIAAREVSIDKLVIKNAEGLKLPGINEL